MFIYSTQMLVYNLPMGGKDYASAFFYQSKYKIPQKPFRVGVHTCSRLILNILNDQKQSSLKTLHVLHQHKMTIIFLL